VVQGAVMSINEIYPMRKRRSINKTPGKTPVRSSSTDGKLSLNIFEFLEQKLLLF